jgi:hypothetical protein
MKNSNQIKSFCLLMVLFFTESTSIGQVLSGDATGKSTVLVEGGNIGINVAAGAAEINYTQFANYFARENFRKLTWGVNARAEADGSVLDIIQGGIVGSKSRLNGFIGLSQFYGKVKADSDLQSDHRGRSINFKTTEEFKVQVKNFQEKETEKTILKAQSLSEDLGLILEARTRQCTTEVKKALSEFLDPSKPNNVKGKLSDLFKKIHDKPYFDTLLKQYNLDSNSEATLPDIIIKEVFENPNNAALNTGMLIKIPEKLRSVSLKYFSQYQQSLEDITGQKEYFQFLSVESSFLYAHLKKSFDDAMKNVTSIKEELDIVENKLREEQARLDEIKTSWRRRGTFYLRSGVEGNRFRLWGTAIDTTNVYKSFSRKSFSGFFSEVGYNYHNGGRFILGTSLGYQVVDNFSDLRKQDVVITQKGKDKIGQEITRTDKTEAYRGNYQPYDRINFNLDLIKFLKFNDEYFVTLNPWVRHKMPFKKHLSIARASTDLGISAYIFKNRGVFMGGIYAGIADITDSQRVIEGNDPIRLGERWSFGIVTKINFIPLIAY